MYQLVNAFYRNCDRGPNSNWLKLKRDFITKSVGIGIWLQVSVTQSSTRLPRSISWLRLIASSGMAHS